MDGGKNILSNDMSVHPLRIVVEIMMLALLLVGSLITTASIILR